MTSGKFSSESVSSLRRNIIPAVRSATDVMPMPTIAANGKKATAKARDATAEAIVTAAAAAPRTKSQC